MSRGLFETPWEVELEIWRALWIRRVPVYKMPAERIVDASTGDEFYVSDRRARSAKKRWETLNKSEWLNLPDDLRRIHHRFDEFRGRVPGNPRQHSAWSKCQEGSHDWMHDPNLAGDCYDVISSQTSNNTLVIHEKHVCYFCGAQTDEM